MTSVEGKATPSLFHEKVSEEGVKPVARQPRVIMSPVPEPHGIRGNKVGAVDEAKKDERHVINITK